LQLLLLHTACVGVVISISIAPVVNDDVSSAVLLVPSSSPPHVATYQQLIALLLTSVHTADAEAQLGPAAWLGSPEAFPQQISATLNCLSTSSGVASIEHRYNIIYISFQ